MGDRCAATKEAMQGGERRQKGEMASASLSYQHRSTSTATTTLSRLHPRSTSPASVCPVSRGVSPLRLRLRRICVSSRCRFACPGAEYKTSKSLTHFRTMPTAKTSSRSATRNLREPMLTRGMSRLSQNLTLRPPLVLDHSTTGQSLRMTLCQATPKPCHAQSTIYSQQAIPPNLRNF